METAMYRLGQISHLLPLPVLQDVDKRCTDWLASGGKEDDPYIHQQLNFARRFVPASDPVEKKRGA